METLIVTQYGAFLGKTSERVQVRLKKNLVEEHPFFQLERIIIAASGVSLSADLVYECAQRGIAIHFLSYNGRPYARLSSPEMLGTVVTRREQLLAYTDERGVAFGRGIVYGKLSNQVAILKYFAKYRKERDRETYERIYERIRAIEELRGGLARVQARQIDDCRGELLSIEGRAARLYWDTFVELVPAEVDFEGREHRGATDPVNSLLNYGYGILYSQIWGAIDLAGLDPFAGFVHADRSGKPSLVFDLIEEFRQQVVDRTVFGLINRGYQPTMEEGRLSDETRKEFARKILDRLEGTERYEGKEQRLRTIVQQQARHLATFFRGERDYRPFVGSW